MAKERTSVRLQTQIKLMSEQGHTIRSIARVLKLSRHRLKGAGFFPSKEGSRAI
jgi:hypothetical protein